MPLPLAFKGFLVYKVKVKSDVGAIIALCCSTFWFLSTSYLPQKGPEGISGNYRRPD